MTTTILDVFERLSYSEFSNLALGNDGDGTIQTGKEGMVASHINAGLKAIYARMSHKRDYVKIEIKEGRTKYKLDVIHTVREVLDQGVEVYADEWKFLHDTEDEPFQNDVLQILDVTLQDDPETTLINEQRTIPINHIDKTHYEDDDVCLQNMTMVDYRTLHIPNGTPGQMLKIEYSAKHPKIVAPFDENQLIELHPALDEALDAYVAYRVFKAMGGDTGEARAAARYQQYDMICMRVASEDLLKQSATVHSTKLMDRGFR